MNHLSFCIMMKDRYNAMRRDVLSARATEQWNWNMKGRYFSLQVQRIKAPNIEGDIAADALFYIRIMPESERDTAKPKLELLAETNFGDMDRDTVIKWINRQMVAATLRA